MGGDDPDRAALFPLLDLSLSPDPQRQKPLAGGLRHPANVLKILFVCTCLEPGLDGVGDYTRRLASELSARGHHCALLALADSRVRTAVSSDAPIPCLRLPADRPWRERILEAKKFVENAAPDWISWQFVLYGFDPRGLGCGLGGRLGEIAEGHRNQIMFHEIWIGEARQATLKNKIIGKLQKSTVNDVLQKIRPLVVHTHTPLYQHFLAALGAGAVRLPLFGNIPIANGVRSGWLEEKGRAVGGKWERGGRDSRWIFVLFGSIHPEWDAEDFCAAAAVAARTAGKQCALLSIGRQGPAGEHKWRLLEQRREPSCLLLNLGVQSEEDISQCLLAADFGVSAMPPEYLFKSGTAAAMIEHGLPVIATRHPYNYPRCPDEIVSIRMNHVVTDFDLARLQKSKVASLLPEVAVQFVGDLQKTAAASPGA